MFTATANVFRLIVRSPVRRASCCCCFLPPLNLNDRAPQRRHDPNITAFFVRRPKRASALDALKLTEKLPCHWRALTKQLNPIEGSRCIIILTETKKMTNYLCTNCTIEKATCGPVNPDVGESPVSITGFAVCESPVKYQSTFFPRLLHWWLQLQI